MSLAFASSLTAGVDGLWEARAATRCLPQSAQKIDACT